uniref:NARG2_C domain-containing protein n=1 Tax=Elaeophora elaphi TaxID=1147741 RepID=A0A158Q6R8_9BILA
MTQLTEAIPKLTNGGALKNDESEDKDEFFDATDVSFGESESDVYDDNVEFVVTESTDLDDDVMLEVDDKLHELGLMLNSTLASDYNGANAARLNAHFFNDWRILLEKQALELGFPNLDELLKSKYMSDYVEQTSVVNGIATYGAVSKPASEHILRRVADCRLNEDQRAEKRRIQRLMKLKSPENEQNFLEGKRRILEILVDLKADKVEVDYQIIRDEYMKRYSISLNASEHLRLFMNKSALKNFWRVFYREVILISGSPIRVKLRSSDVKIPEEITEDLHLLANIDKIELPIFALECRPQISNIIREGRTVKYSKGVAVSGETIPKKPTMDWGEEMEEDEDRQASNEKQRKSDIGNADRINGTVSSSMTKTMCFPADSEGVQENGDDRAQRRLSQKPVDLTDGKYTGDEESADSSDPEGKVSRKYRKKKFKGNVNTFNISTSSEVKPLVRSFCLLQKIVIGSLNPFYYSGKNSNSVEQSSRLMDNGENKFLVFQQSGKRLKIAERSLQQSLGHFYPRDRFPSSFTAFNNRNSAGLVPMYKPTQSAVFNRQCSEEYHETRASEHRNFDLYSEEVNLLCFPLYLLVNAV